MIEWKLAKELIQNLNEGDEVEFKDGWRGIVMTTQEIKEKLKTETTEEFHANAIINNKGIWITATSYGNKNFQADAHFRNYPIRLLHKKEKPVIVNGEAYI